MKHDILFGKFLIFSLIMLFMHVHIRYNVYFINGNVVRHL